MVQPHATQENRLLPYAAGIPATLRVVFIPGDAHALLSLVQDRQFLFKGLEPDVQYRGLYFNPKDGNQHNLGTVSGDAQGNYVLPLPPIRQDWVVVLERQDASVV